MFSFTGNILYFHLTLQIPAHLYCWFLSFLCHVCKLKGVFLEYFPESKWIPHLVSGFKLLSPLSLKMLQNMNLLSLFLLHIFSHCPPEERVSLSHGWIPSFFFTSPTTVSDLKQNMNTWPNKSPYCLWTFYTIMFDKN